MIRCECNVHINDKNCFSYQYIRDLPIEWDCQELEDTGRDKPIAGKSAQITFTCHIYYMMIINNIFIIIIIIIITKFMSLISF